MQYRTLGSTGLRVSRLALGSGPVASVMLGKDTRRQQQLLRHALDVGINWIDTAAGYGEGASERNVRAALQALGAEDAVLVATKVRVASHELTDIAAGVRQSVAASLKRLQSRRITLLQLHNTITRRRDEEPTSLTPQDVIGHGGVLEAFDQLRQEGCGGLTSGGRWRSADAQRSSMRLTSEAVPCRTW